MIISHAHGDHIGGITDGDGNISFPNARFVMWKGEWDYWTDESNLAEMPEARANFARKNLLPIADRVFTLDSDEPTLLLGENRGVNAVEFALTALASCMTGTLVYYAAAMGIELEEVSAELEGDLAQRASQGLSWNL